MLIEMVVGPGSVALALNRMVTVLPQTVVCTVRAGAMVTTEGQRRAPAAPPSHVSVWNWGGSNSRNSLPMAAGAEWFRVRETLVTAARVERERAANRGSAGLEHRSASVHFPSWAEHTAVATPVHGAAQATRHAAVRQRRSSVMFTPVEPQSGKASQPEWYWRVGVGVSVCSAVGDAVAVAVTVGVGVAVAAPDAWRPKRATAHNHHHA